MSDDYIDQNPALDDALIFRLTYDLATRIHPYPTIAMRYGFAGVGGLTSYLSNHPEIVLNIKKARAVIDSDAGTEERVRMKALQATEDLIVPTKFIAADPRVPAQQRIDAFKQLSRVAAVDGSAAAAAQKASGGAAFTLNILFREKPESLNFVANNVTTDRPELPHNSNTPTVVTVPNDITDSIDEADYEDEDV